METRIVVSKFEKMSKNNVAFYWIIQFLPESLAFVRGNITSIYAGFNLFIDVNLNR